MSRRARRRAGTTDLRLSDAERETASQALGEHFAQGRLDADEHAERHERVWTAKTRGEIPPLFADLPGGSPLHPAPPRTARPGAAPTPAVGRAVALHPAAAPGHPGPGQDRRSASWSRCWSSRTGGWS